MKTKNPEYAAGYKQADADNTTARASLLEAIAEAKREATDIHNHETTRAHWQQKAKRWQANLALTRALALNRTMAANTDKDTRVVLTGDGEWRGTLAEFFAENNCLSDETIADIRQTLASGKAWETGGGAAAYQVLRRECDEQEGGR